MASLLLVALVACSSTERPDDRPLEPSAGSGPEQPSASLAAEAALLQRSVTVHLDAPTPADPVAAALVVEPAEVLAGDLLVLVVRVRTAGGWHVYAPDPRTPPAYLVASIQVDLPPGMTAVGPWHWPPARMDPVSQAPILSGEFELRRLVRATEAAAPGVHAIAATLGYQACDPFRCLPPASTALLAELRLGSGR
jgi:hypothetical protein